MGLKRNKVCRALKSSGNKSAPGLWEASGKRQTTFKLFFTPRTNINTVSMTPRRFECKNEPTLGNQVGATRALRRLSTELLVETLAYLPAADMISVQRTCRTIRDIIAGTAYLQYTLRAGINGVEDFLLPGVSYSERLELLRRHEQSWDSLQFDLFTKCDILHMPSFTLQDGYLINQHFVFVAREGLPLEYHYTDLCSAARNEDLHWVEVIMRETGNISPFHPRVIFAVDQDLVVVVRFFVLSNSFWRAKS